MLPRQERLLSGSKIREIVGARQYEGKRPLLYLVARANFLPHSRLAVVVPRFIGCAVKRNLLRRRIYEVFGRLKGNIKRQIDVVVYPRKISTESSFSCLFSEFCGIFKSFGNTVFDA